MGLLASQEACAGFVSWCSIQSEYGVTRKEVWEQGVAGSSPVAPTIDRLAPECH